MPAAPTRTLNPLPFEHLEPKRFEDLVRQLAYSFRPWRQLEATGRGGSDDGFDARGFEIVGEGLESDPDDAEDASPVGATDRLWLIQCKRERVIGPAKMVEHLDAIPPASREGLHGILFVAACDFSKKTRDAFRNWCAAHAGREWYLWGKAELEDALFLPDNDHLLFAYFGISLTIRKRSEQARLRTVTTLKRKLKRHIVDAYRMVMRNVADREYPYRERGRVNENGYHWSVHARPRLTHQGLEITLQTCHALLHEDKVHWDCAEVSWSRLVDYHESPWTAERTDEVLKISSEAWKFWFDQPRNSHATLELRGVISLDDIVEVDEVGDDIIPDAPHLFVRVVETRPDPFSSIYRVLVLHQAFDD